MKVIKRILSLTLSGAMVLSLCAQPAFAEGTVCGHKHTEGCYRTVTDCTHEHGPECYPDNENIEASPSEYKKQGPTECSHKCSEESGCIRYVLDCGHEHDASCGYVPEDTDNGWEGFYEEDEVLTGDGSGEDEDSEATPSDAPDNMKEEGELKEILEDIELLSEEGVRYVDENGDIQTQDNVTVVEETSTEWSEGWYVVNSDAIIADRVTVTGKVDLILADGASLKAEKGIEVAGDNSLTIYGQEGGSGELTATADGSNAGIGGGDNGAGGTITISGGIVTATGGNGGAAIGGGFRNQPGGKIIITGGKVTAARNKSGGAGIGSGQSGGSVDIDISGGEINAKSFIGAAIGSGCNGEGAKINISGGTVTATGGSDGGAGIGGGINSRTGTINISGGKVTATGDYGGAGIGAGKDASVWTVTISGGTVIAKGGNSGAGIGGHGENINITGGEVTATGGNSGAGIGGHGGIINITGGEVNATGGYGGAGIGASGGYDPMGSNMGFIIISGGTVTATGGSYGGAGIGGGRHSSEGSINISGGKVTANGSSDGGAGIGGGNRIFINVSGGTVVANGGKDGYGIGGSRFGGGRDLLQISDGAVIFADSIQDKSGEDRWNGIVFEGDRGQVYGGTVVLKEDFELESGKELMILVGTSLTIPKEAELTVNGTINNNGNLTVEGELFGNGSITPKLEPSITIDELSNDGSPLSEDDVTYSYDGDADADITITWYSSNNEGRIGDALEGAPTEPGTYWVKVAASATNFYQAAEAESSFTIEEPQEPEEPTEPTEPEEPEGPTDPEDPEKPTEPEEPEGPTDPEGPEEPSEPGGGTSGDTDGDTSGDSTADKPGGSNGNTDVSFSEVSGGTVNGPVGVYYADGSSAGTTDITEGSWEMGTGADGSISWRYSLNDGSYAAGRWLKINWNGEDHWYHFDADGYLQGGWYTDTDGKIYYLHPLHDDSFGYMYTGDRTIDGIVYSFSRGIDIDGLPEGALLDR